MGLDGDRQYKLRQEFAGRPRLVKHVHALKRKCDISQQRPFSRAVKVYIRPHTSTGSCADDSSRCSKIHCHLGQERDISFENVSVMSMIYLERFL